jgi:hypothetical protein
MVPDDRVREALEVRANDSSEREFPLDAVAA